MDFAVQMDHTVKMKESKKIDKYLDLARELKKQWNVKVTVILTVVDEIIVVSKGVEQRLEELVWFWFTDLGLCIFVYMSIRVYTCVWL